MLTFSSDVIFTNKPDRENNHSSTGEISSHPELYVGISFLPAGREEVVVMSSNKQQRREDNIGNTNAMTKRNHQRLEVRDNDGKKQLFHGCQIKTQRSGLAFPSMVK
jgi:hypothetical protein